MRPQRYLPVQKYLRITLFLNSALRESPGEPCNETVRRKYHVCWSESTIFIRAARIAGRIPPVKPIMSANASA